jgi:hypothetical protein
MVRYSYGKNELAGIERLKDVSCDCFGLAMQAIEDYLRDIQSYPM